MTTLSRVAGGGIVGAIVTLAGLMTVHAAAAQSLAERIGAVRDGRVRLSYPTRPGVCGSGHNISMSRSTEHWEPDCEPGPARVMLTFRRGELVGVDTYVGGRWKASGEAIVDLGAVRAPDAASYLLSLAASANAPAGDDVIFPATIADGFTAWPRLVEIARNESLRTATRKGAVFWLGQAAGAQVMQDLADLAQAENMNRDIQEHAVFALSQLREDEGIPPLLVIARTHRDPHVRKNAMFWLGQSGDDRAIALFEEILMGSRSKE
ncbi:MAG TPA: HEAT repeat domain-containing protein [Gemmatimonadales bacterium]|nr:HEAT repeat domain-containing protein [Gemmatimonadales bacterium]